MTLENLLKIGQLKSHVTSKEEVQRLLGAARRNLADAEVEAISTETRFDSAYKAIMQEALAALMANGYRPDTDSVVANDHRAAECAHGCSRCTAPQAEPDRLYRRLGGRDFMENCIAEAKALLQDVEAWLREHRPDLLGA